MASVLVSFISPIWGFVHVSIYEKFFIPSSGHLFTGDLAHQAAWPPRTAGFRHRDSTSPPAWFAPAAAREPGRGKARWRVAAETAPRIPMVTGVISWYNRKFTADWIASIWLVQGESYGWMWLKLTETLYFMAKTKLENDYSFLQILPESMAWWLSYEQILIG